MKQTTHLNSQKIISGFVPKQLSFDYKIVENHLENFYKLHTLKGNKDSFFDLEFNNHINYFNHYVDNGLLSYYDMFVFPIKCQGYKPSKKDDDYYTFETEDIDNCPELTVILPINKRITVNFKYHHGRLKNLKGKIQIPVKHYMIINSDVEIKIESEEENMCLISHFQFDRK